MAGEVQVDDTRLNLKLGKLQPAVHDALVVVVKGDARTLLGRMQSLANGDLVQVRTGKFLKSLKARVRQSRNRVKATVGSKSKVAHILEGGAAIPPHEIVPNTAHALLFRARGGSVFAAKVNSPGGKIDPRLIVQTAFDGMKDVIEQDMVDAARTAAAGV